MFKMFWSFPNIATEPHVVVQVAFLHHFGAVNYVKKKKPAKTQPMARFKASDLRFLGRGVTLQLGMMYDSDHVSAGCHHLDSGVRVSTRR
jgi:intracellular sulfur oxidation DsrE/DsrF family protein